jgi:L-2-hydroxyglutarate oxidase
LVPEITPRDIQPAGAGVRAQALLACGELANDFVFTTTANAVHVLNAPSPGATAALAIGDEIAERVVSLIPRPAAVGSSARAIS